MTFKTNLLRSALFAAAAAVALIPAARADDHMIVKESARSVSETIDTLQAALEEKGISIVGRVDHQASAMKAGLELPPTMLLIFGNPKLGTPLMQTNRRIGIDLPMKALAWEADGKVYLAYTDPRELKDRHDIDGQDEIFDKMSKALGAFTDKATAK
ncbi:MAG: DUF302 domain-containing protein [Alphaproteobacteria bacterium]|nr:DUF302 domain-containing protein [Alphaproteobacteria bacterium]